MICVWVPENRCQFQTVQDLLSVTYVVGLSLNPPLSSWQQDNIYRIKPSLLYKLGVLGLFIEAGV